MYKKKHHDQTYKQNKVHSDTEKAMKTDKSITDRSHFVPTSEAVKGLNGRAFTSDVINSAYDFPDGVDNGMAIPMSRSNPGVDLSELSVAKNKAISDLDKSIKKASDHKKFSDKVDAHIAEIQSRNKSSESSVNSVNSGNSGE